MSASGRVPKVGDIAEIGDTVALGIEPGERYARIVGVLHNGWYGLDSKGPSTIGPFVIRKFRSGDNWFPTGSYATTSAIGVCPIDGTESDEEKLLTPGCMERPDQDERGPF
jgi:hypothetical protein